MPRVDQLLAESPASVAALKDVLGVDAVVSEVSAIESRLQEVEESLSTGPTMTLLPTTRTTPEDVQISGNVFTGSSTISGSLSVMEYSVAGIVGKAAAGVRINIPNVGSLIIYADGEYSVEFNLNWNGTVPQITFMATNGSEVRLATVNITVTAVDDPPVASNNSAMTAINEAVTFNIMANDYDPEASALILTHVHGLAVAIGAPIVVPHGTVVVNSNRTLTFTPTTDYTGLVQFMYTVSDGNLSASARVNIQVGFENIPMFSPVQPIDTDDFFDQCAMNFGNTYMGWVGEAYDNGVNVTNATYGTAQGRFDLATMREPWLYDRPTQVYKLYLRTKDPAIRARALEMAELYMEGVITINGNEGDFMTGSGGTAQDPKYQYPLIAWWYERETGDMQYRTQAAGMYRLLYRAYPPIYSTERPLWTERNTTYALTGCLAQYWLTGDAEALTRAEAYFEMVLEMSEITGAPLHPYNQHEDDGPSTPVSSPWMSGMMVEAFVQLYRTNGDERIVEWIARFCDWVVASGFYVNYEVPEFIGHRIPCYLVGAVQQFPDLGGAAADSEHCYDVAIMLQKGIWAKQRLGQDSTQMQAVVYEQLFVADLVFRTWIRATVGLPRYRVNPPRKYGWWFNGAYTTIQSAGVVPMGPLITAAPTLVGNSAVGSLLTHTPGTYGNAVTLTRQWCRDGSPIVGATGLTYQTTVDDVGLPVYCEETATFNGESIVRRSATVVIATSGTAPTISAQPSNATVTAGANATFNFTATGTGLTYSWESRVNSGGSWTTISSALANSYTHTAAQEAQTGMQFRGRVTNSGGSAYTDIVTLTVNAAAATAPVVTTHPQNQTIQEDSPASLTVAFTGTAPVAIQWFMRINSGASWNAVSGATSANYQSANLQVSDSGHQYRARLTNSAAEVFSNVATVTVDAALEELELVQNLDYVNTSSTPYTAFIAFVNAKRSGGNPYGYMPEMAALAYRITGDESYRTLAIAGVNEMITLCETQIAGGGPATEISGDSYLEVGPQIGGLAKVYAWCNPDQTTKDRWAVIADQAVYNIWNYGQATWGGNSHPWTGWSVNDPGNNYHYSFLTATAYWALASNNHTWIQYLNTFKLPPLRTYFANLASGGSREGTGYGAAFRALFAFYEIWEASGMSNLSAANTHLTKTIDYWIHATMPGFARYCPIGDLSRESYPNLFDYHRELVLRARYLTTDVQALADSSWWLNKISVQNMSQGYEHAVNMLPAGSNTTVPPNALSFYSSGTGSLFTRTGWGNDDVFFAFLAGIYDQSHAAMAQGSFTLYKGGFLSTTNNIFSHSGIQQGVRTNNVLRFMTSGGATIGQNNGVATQTNEIGENGNVTASANLKPIINNATVTAWTRDVEFLDGVLTVEDTYSTTSGTTAVFQICTPTEPTIVGNVITCGDLQATVIEPGSPTITAVRGLTEDADVLNGWRVDISGGVGSYVVELRSISFSPNDPGPATPPTINTHPSNQSVNVGQNATFAVSITGTGLSYQWYGRASGVSRPGTLISGATSSSYVRTTEEADTGNIYYCTITNSGGSVTSNDATLTVTVPPPSPNFTTHPSSTSVPDGDTASFTVAAENYTGLQWQFMASGGSWANVGGATALTYDRVTSMSDNGGQVRCVATNAAGSTNSNAAALTVTMNIGVDPLEYSVGLNAVTDGLRRVANLFPGGKSFTLQMLCSLDAGPTSAWLNANTIMGAQYTSRMHTVGLNSSLQMGVRNNEFGNTNNFAVSAATWYLVSLTSDSGDNQAGNIRVTFQAYEGESEPALLASAQHKGEYFGGNNAMQSLCYGGAGQFEGLGWPRAMRIQSMRCYNHVRNDTQIRADRHNTDPAGAMWWWDAIPGTEDELVIVDRTGNNVVPTLEGTLTLEEGPGDGLGGGGPGGTAPSFLSQPTDQAVVEGQSFNFIAEVDGDPAPTLEWQRNIADVWTAVGDTDDAFAGTATLDMDGYQYRLVATNGSGSVNSDTVTLTVTAAPSGQEFGYSGPTNASVPGSGNRSAGTPYVKSGAGRVNRIAARFVADTASASTARVLCYSVVGGVPTTLLWATAIATVPAAGGTVEFAIPASGIGSTDAAGTYALMIVTSDWPQRLGSATDQAGYTTYVSYGSVSIASPPATWPTSDTTYADVAMAVWCEYGDVEEELSVFNAAKKPTAATLSEGDTVVRWDSAADQHMQLEGYRDTGDNVWVEIELLSGTNVPYATLGLANAAANINNFAGADGNSKGVYETSTRGAWSYDYNGGSSVEIGSGLPQAGVGTVLCGYYNLTTRRFFVFVKAGVTSAWIGDNPNTTPAGGHAFQVTGPICPAVGGYSSAIGYKVRIPSEFTETASAPAGAQMGWSHAP